MIYSVSKCTVNVSASSISSQIMFSLVNVLCSFLVTINFEKPNLEIYVLHVFTK